VRRESTSKASKRLLAYYANDVFNFWNQIPEPKTGSLQIKNAKESPSEVLEMSWLAKQSTGGNYPICWKPFAHQR